MAKAVSTPAKKDSNVDTCKFRWVFYTTLSQMSNPMCSEVFYSARKNTSWYLCFYPPKPGNEKQYRLALFLNQSSKIPLEITFQLTLKEGSRIILDKPGGKILNFHKANSGYYVCNLSSLVSVSELQISITEKGTNKLDNVVNSKSIQNVANSGSTVNVANNKSIPNVVNSMITPNVAPDIIRDLGILKENARTKDETSNVTAMGANTDLELKVGKSSIAAHQVIIAAASPVLEMMMLNLSQTDDVQVLTIEGFAFDVVQAVVQFIYTRELRSFRHLRQQKVLKVLECASRYEVECLRSVVLEHLEMQFSLHNIVDMLLFADSHGEQELKDKAVDYICANRASLARHNIFKNLQHHPQLMEQILMRLSV